MISNKYLLAVGFIICFACTSRAQYVEKEPEQKVTTLYPEMKFDSVQARNALARGTSTIKGVAFTKPKTGFGYKAPLAGRIYANKMKVILYPVTPYFEEWYKLRKDKENYKSKDYKKRVYVYLSDAAYRYRLEAITNSQGEFTFPDMRPGKYFLTGNLSWDATGTYDQYTGSGYNNYGGTTDYYDRKSYTINHQDRIEAFVEIKTDGEIVEMKLK